MKHYARIQPVVFLPLFWDIQHIYNRSSPDGHHYIPPTDENYPKSIAESKCPHLGGPWPKRSLGGLLL